MRFTLGLAAIALSGSVFGQAFNGVARDKDAVVLLPPVAVADSVAERMEWSPSCRYLAVVRRDPGITPAVLASGQGPVTELFSITVFEPATGAIQVVWKGQPGDSEPRTLVWVGRSDTLVYQVQSPTGVRVRAFQVGRKTTVELANRAGSTPFVVDASPVHPLGFVIDEGATVRLLPFSPAGMGEPVPLPVGVFGSLWHRSEPVAFLFTKTAAEGGARYLRWGGKELAPLRDLPNDELAGREPTVGPTLRVQLERNEGLGVHSAYLSRVAPTTPRAVVGYDVSQVSLAPNESAVAYIVAGVAMVRRLAPVSKDFFTRLESAQAQSEAIMRAKTAGLAAILYAADNGDIFPGMGEDLQNRLMPYLQNRDVMKGFVYTFRGGPIKDLANTELGFTSAPGGRAVVFADGSVRWRPGP